MKTDSIQQEILLMATTTFSKREWCGKDAREERADLSLAEQLEEICWNGLIDELLPEIIERTPTGEKLYLWQIRPAEAYIQIELCNFPMAMEQATSIDPFLFMINQIYN